MSNIVLTPGIRQNLLSLQNTAALMQTTQNRLATGKKVNSALDNPVSFFMSQSLGDRANDLSNLLDSIGQAQQTLQAANAGITSLTTLVNSLKSMATQAQQSTPPSATYKTDILGNTAIAADTSRAVSANTFGSLTGLTPAAHSTYTINTTAMATAAAADGDKVTLSDGTHTLTLEKISGGAAAAGNVGFKNATDIQTALSSFFGSQYSLSGSTVTITGGDFTTNFAAAVSGGTGGGDAMAAAVTTTPAASGDTLSISQGATTATLRYVASGGVAADGTFSSLTELNAAINASSVGTLPNPVLASDDGNGNLKLDTDATTGFSVSGTIATALGFNTTLYKDNYNSTLAGLSGKLSITVGAPGTAQTIDLDAVKTRAGLATALGNLTGITAGVDATTGMVSLSSTSSGNVTISGTGTAASGLFAGANIGVNPPTVTTGGTSATRTTLQANFNDLLGQIDQLAGDSSYNGINLIHGDTLKVVFNENGTSFLNIPGVTLSAAGLGLTALTNNEFQDNTQIDTVIGNINDALAQLRAQASAFGSTLTTVQTRQDFTKNLINTLQVGGDNLVLADTNEEGANLLALQTRQSLSTTALSLANQANQAVLRLFG